MREAVSVWRGLNVEEEKDWRRGVLIVVAGVRIMDRGCLEIDGDGFESARERRGTIHMVFIFCWSV